MINRGHALRLLRAGFPAACLSVFCFNPARSQPAFQEVSKAQGVDFVYGVGSPAGGVSCADFDGDGKDDLTLCAGNGKTMAFYRNTGSGFIRLPLAVAVTEESKHALWADFDNDGDKDLFVSTRYGRNYLYRNNGNLVMEDITAAAGLFMGVEPSYGAAWADIDRDGWLDLFVTSRKINQENLFSTNRLYRNQGNGTFEEITLQAGLKDETKSPYCAAFMDADGDQWPDIYIAQDKRTLNSLFINLHHANFQDRASESNADASMFGMSVSCADIDRNGTQEIYITNTVGSKFLVNHSGVFTEEAHARGIDFIGGYGWGASFLDAENDGDADLYVSGSQAGSAVSSAFYVNTGDGDFEEQAGGFISDTLSSYSNAVGDFNLDGYADILVSNSEPYAVQLWRNAGGSNKWIKFRLTGTLSNRDGTGSTIEVYSGGKRQTQYTQSGVSYLGQNSFDLLFGLGLSSTADSVFIRWPSGHNDKLYNVAVNQIVTLVEGATASFTPQLSHEGLIQLCAGDSLVLHTGLFGSGVSWLWSTGETTPEITVKNPGDYSVEVVSAALGLNWVSPGVSVEVNDTGAPELDIVVTGPSCYNTGDGSIGVELSGGSPPYEVVWSSGETSLELTNLEAGYYQLQVSDEAGCEALQHVVVPQPEPFLLEHTLFEISFGKFAIQLSTYGGINPIHYEWNFPNAPNLATVTNLDPGDYEVVATDAEGCIAERQITLESALVTSVETRNVGIILFPNPVDTSLTVRLTGGANECFQFIITSATGMSTGMDYCPPFHGSDLTIPSTMIYKGLNYIQIMQGGKEIHRAKVIVN